jgi:ABC-2 type transport system ATP-binding protein
MSWGVCDLTVRYGRRTALDRVSLDVQPGTLTAVVGADGAGKTTLLRALVGVLRPDMGTVTHPPAPQIGYFSAAAAVYPDLTVEENLDFAATAYRAHDRKRRADLLGAAGLSDVTHQLGAQLSGGMRHKLGLLIAMLHRPALLVLDEPSTGIDPVSRTELSTLIMRAAASGAAVVASTVYLDEAERANHVVVLDSGRVLCAGTPDSITSSIRGQVVQRAIRPDSALAWRRGNGWHQWIAPADRLPEHVQLLERLDLEDAVIVATLQGRP